MRSIERRFAQKEKARPDSSSLVNFAGAIRGQRFSTNIIHRWFTTLVEADDYQRSDKRAILRYLVLLSNPVRTTENGG